VEADRELMEKQNVGITARADKTPNSARQRFFEEPEQTHA
jgi:hypothetical protein